MEYVEMLVRCKFMQISDEMLTIRPMLFDLIHLKYYWTKATVNDKWIKSLKWNPWILIDNFTLAIISLIKINLLETWV